MVWLIYQIIAIIGVTAVHTFNRWASAHAVSFLTKWMINIGAQAVIAPMFILSYALAPSFFQPWFLGTILIALIGFGVSLLFFGEALTLLKVVGAILGLVSAVLLIL
jgi:hypothetical protein